MSENSQWDTHRFLDGIALAYHRVVAGCLFFGPEAVIRPARENLTR